ncbi:hypothetical protein J2851_005637 [Azospirillum rugosum]|uniref:Uncharacterized protein n=1 Tax=Azospirillum rugosum TaxID=416170 RepID=A0ABS4STE6_9PROT|nr:hypothetical protein [Azospirillum rugosum]MDQ0529065.1 hypothetical protein [Azospirillum rugosum]
MHDHSVHRRRGILIRLRKVVEGYERHGQDGVALVRGLRYELAVRATEVNGDACAFPACPCSKADCVSRPRPQSAGASPRSDPPLHSRVRL